MLQRFPWPHPFPRLRPRPRPRPLPSPRTLPHPRHLLPHPPEVTSGHHPHPLLGCPEVSSGACLSMNLSLRARAPSTRRMGACNAHIVAPHAPPISLAPLGSHSGSVLPSIGPCSVAFSSVCTAVISTGSARALPAHLLQSVSAESTGGGYVHQRAEGGAYGKVCIHIIYTSL